MAITTTYNAKTELDTGAARLSIRQPLATYDSNAHIFRAEITRAGETVDLTGATCIGYFVRADGVTVPIDGAVESNAASVTLAPSCYAVPGRFDLAVKLTLDDVVHTVMQVNGTVEISQTDSMTSPGDGVQSFDKLAEAASKVIEYDLRITAVEVEADRIPDTVRVNLASTAAASFNGMANITPGVTGVLPLGNGGTGATDAAGARTKLGVPSVEEMQQRDRVANLLDNSDFTAGRVVNQRGFTSTKLAAVYTVDRWLADSGNNAAEISIGNGGITLTPTATNDAGIYQKLENYAAMSGKVYTIGVCINNAWETATFTMAAAAGGYVLPSGLKVYSTGGFHVLIRNLGGKSPVTIQRVALYEGAYTAETLPAYVYKGYAAELAECQRYYFTMPNDPFANGQTIGAGNAMMFSIQTPVALRVNEPTLDLHGGSLTIRCNGADYPVTAVSQQGKTGCFVYFMAQAEGLPAKHACASYVTGGGSKVALSADL